MALRRHDGLHCRSDKRQPVALCRVVGHLVQVQLPELTSCGLSLRVRTRSDMRLGPLQLDLARPSQVGCCTLDMRHSMKFTEASESCRNFLIRIQSTLSGVGSFLHAPTQKWPRRPAGVFGAVLFCRSGAGRKQGGKG